MFRIIQGAPGSGKSFYAVNYLKKFCTYDKLYDIMLLNSDVLLVTNIDDVKVQHMTINDFREKDLINPEILKEYLNSHNYKRVIYIHDEAQKILGGIRDNREFFFFEYHRHLGIDCFLICPTVSALPRRLTEIAEYIIEAKPKTISIIGFGYYLKDSKTGGKIGAITLKKDVNVFRLYKSFDIKEVEGPKKLILHKLIAGGIVMCCSFALVFVMLNRAFENRMSPSKQKASVTTTQSIAQVMPGSASTPPAPQAKTLEMPESNYFVKIENQTDTDRRPGGRLRGVSKTDQGVYFFY